MTSKYVGFNEKPTTKQKAIDELGSLGYVEPMIELMELVGKSSSVSWIDLSTFRQIRNWLLVAYDNLVEMARDNFITTERRISMESITESMNLIDKFIRAYNKMCEEARAKTK